MTPPIDPGNRHFLVVVADESKAVIYRRDKLSGPLQEIATFQAAVVSTATARAVTR